MDSARQFGLTAFTVQENTAGLTHEDSLRPAGAGNCLNWVLGHILAARQRLFALIGVEPFWPAERVALYDRGSPPVTAASAVPLADLLRDFGRSQEQLEARLASLSEADLARSLPDDAPEVLGETVGSALVALAWHEGYHAGQIGILRRLAGREGALE